MTKHQKIFNQMLKENKNLLTQDELEILQEIVEIKRKKKSTWGI